MKKLLTQSLKPLIIYALVILVLSIPVYFISIDITWKQELDKHHNAIKFKIESRLNQLDMSEVERAKAIEILNRIEPGFSLKAVNKSEIRADSTYNVIRFDDFIQEREQFRGLVTYIQIKSQFYRVVIETNMEEIDETILIISGVAILFIVLLLVGFVILTRKSSIKIWQPFYQTLQKLKMFDLDKNKVIALPQSDIIEFSELNHTLANLIKENLSVFRRQKEFTENASHELQTPLAIIKLKLDLLLQNKSLNAELAQQIDVSISALNRASRINKNLLLLAKIENQQFTQEKNMDLKPIISESLDQLTDYIENKLLTVELEIESKQLIEADETLIQILFNNLLMNAINHSPPNSRIVIRCVNHQLTLKNSGIKELNNQDLFQRFGKTSNHKTGTGLGLAIVKEICNQYNWTIDYSYEAGMHHFIVNFMKPDF